MNSRLTGIALVVCLMILVGAALSALVLPQKDEEDRPPIIVSSGSVILNVARGSWVREAAGRYRQELAQGRDVRSFSAITGTGTGGCTVVGDSILVTYGASVITFGRPAAPAAPGQRRAATVRLQADAAVTLRDPRTLVIATTDPLVSVSNGGTRPQDTCRIVGARVEIRQIH